MKNNQFFDFDRFAKCCKLELMLEGRYYLIKMAISTLLISMPLFQNKISWFSYTYNSSLSSLILLSASSILMYDVFVRYNVRFRDVNTFMIPNSLFEKLLSIIVINLFLILFNVIIYVVFFEISIFVGIPGKWSDIEWSYVVTFASFLFVIQAFFLIGSLYFKEYSYAKTVGVFILMLVVVSSWSHELGKYFTDYPTVFASPSMLGSWMMQYNTFNPGSGVYFVGDKRIFEIGHSVTALNWLHGITAAVVTFGLWLATYFRLTEKEV